ncbi:hypothetical protein FA13DRAFT_1727376 [Coprinellus micaceus]|uniref:Uncharacterized protein n=1 Tax=Coprinellus micaceus TaxID=71717 RepID=A0A4Y7TSA6_COPMI|nr:hypothetical protein FA13DRAFT_1727376 [Coprinellus micaceus]
MTDTEDLRRGLASRSVSTVFGSKNRGTADEKGAVQPKTRGWKKVRVPWASKRKAGRAGTRGDSTSASRLSSNSRNDEALIVFDDPHEGELGEFLGASDLSMASPPPSPNQGGRHLNPHCGEDVSAVSEIRDGEDTRVAEVFEVGEPPQDEPLLLAKSEPQRTHNPHHYPSPQHALPSVEDLRPHLRLPTHDPASVLTAVLPNAQNFTIQTFTIIINSGSETRAVLGNIRYSATENDPQFEKNKLRGLCGGLQLLFFGLTGLIFNSGTLMGLTAVEMPSRLDAKSPTTDCFPIGKVTTVVRRLPLSARIMHCYDGRIPGP